MKNLTITKLKSIKYLTAVLIMFFSLFGCKANSQQIFVNQTGYLPYEEKYALAENSGNNITNAKLIDAVTGKSVFEITPAIENKTLKLDFSDFNKTGSYKVKFANGVSYPFSISTSLYDKMLYSVAKSFYYQRCGTSVKDETGNIIHNQCHLKDGYVKRADSSNEKDKFIDCTGGWHDAGDFGKYTASTATAAALLLSAFENSSKLKTLNLKLENSNSAMPDMLTEIKYALDWLLKMQRADGAVYRKCSGEKWPGEILPEADTLKRYVFGISTQETGKFSAVMAMAYRVFKNYDRVFAVKCLNASVKSYNYLQNHPYYVDYEESDNSGSGGYPDYKYDKEPSVYTDLDDRIWAAAELFVATRNKIYSEYYARNIDRIDLEPFSWKNPAFMGTANLALFSDGEVKEQARKRVKQLSDEIMDKMQNNPYYVPFDEFKWGSNAAFLNSGVVLYYAYLLDKDEKYSQYALKTVNYVLGCNPLNKSYITGFGSNSVKHPHHRIMQSTGKVTAGFLIGGANNTSNDGVATPDLGIKSYIDDSRSYATNEYAIDYNAPMLFLISLL